MEKIHTSHSKSELCEICEIFNINIADHKKINKTNLAKQLLYQLSIIDEIKEDNDYYFVKNKKELMDYLVNPDSSKTLTVKQKEEVMELAKYIIMYCKNGFYLSHSPFLDYDDMIEKANHIAGYGDIPSVRKAIEGLNGDTKLTKKIEILMSSRCKKKMERKKRLNSKYYGGLIVNKGKFIVSFN
tara:strand:+ start:115 stop:669 length:555 start_codon:yes stop_codon:yes gene_type:complete